MRIGRFLSTLAVVVGFCGASTTFAADKSLTIDNVLVTLIEQVSVPAREAGVLSAIEVREGDYVEEGAFLGQVDETAARLAEARARIELDVAQREADNDVNLQYAKKAAEVAKAELQRAMESVDKFKKSISDTEIDRLRLAAEKEGLQIEQIEHEQEIEVLNLKLRENDVDMANYNLERLRIVAPLAGVVVQVNRRRGEWVQPGEAVFRLLRVDRLRAEAFIDAASVTGNLAGKPVVLRVQLPNQEEPQQFPGRLVFVSPEVDPVNGQIHVWAEVENRDLLLRPGVRATMTIELAE